VRYVNNRAASRRGATNCAFLEGNKPLKEGKNRGDRIHRNDGCEGGAGDVRKTKTRKKEGDRKMCQLNAGAEGGVEERRRLPDRLPLKSKGKRCEKGHRDRAATMEAEKGGINPVGKRTKENEGSSSGWVGRRWDPE